MSADTVDEDAPLISLHSKGNLEDDDPTDEVPDFQLLAASRKSKSSIPKRGEKDFETHGTRSQEDKLNESRNAMHDELSHTRVHIPKSQHRAWYFGEGVVEPQAREALLSYAVRGRGLEKDHVVLVENAASTHYRTMGKSTMGTNNPRIWLLPEEALYLIERGTLDIWWPSRPLDAVKGSVVRHGAENLHEDDADDGTPLSLQAAYALLIGEDDEEGKTSLERFTVFTNLKRLGYVVLRAHPSHDPPAKVEVSTLAGHLSTQAISLFSFLFGNILGRNCIQCPPYGPLVKPGLYRSYNDIYLKLTVVPRHVPLQQLAESPSSAEDPFNVVFNVWKPTRIPTFAKSDPGIPDFRIAVVSSQSSNTPTLTQLTTLLENTPWDPPSKEWKGPAKRYQRLKHGWRNVILAVVDQGVISYLRMSETAFGEERLHESFDRVGGPRGGKGGAKRGGGRGRGGRGRGRGR